MPPFITDKMFSVAFWIWDLPGLAHDRWIIVEEGENDEFVFTHVIADTWIGRIADRFAAWLYYTASYLTDFDDPFEAPDDETYYLDEVLPTSRHHHFGE